MQIRVKPLKGAEFTVDGADGNTTIGDLKKLIEAQQGEDFPAESLKLILLGKIPGNDKKLQDIEFNEVDNYFVLVVSKKKKKAKKAPIEAASNSTNQASSANTTQGATTSQATTQGNNQGGAPVVSNPLVSDEAVQNIVGMGFAESDVRAALSAAFGDANRAVEFLTNPELMQAAVARNRVGGNALGGTPGSPATTAAANQSDDPLTRFRNSPQFQATRALVANNPTAIQGVLERMQTENPELYAAVSRDQQSTASFIDLLTGDDDGAAAPSRSANPFGSQGGGLPGASGLPGGPGGMISPEMLMQVVQLLSSLPKEQRAALLRNYGLTEEVFEHLATVAGGAAGGGLGGAGGAPMMPRNTIQLSQAEAQAVDRLTELGFSRNACLEAYLACDKDEQLAANLLFTNPPEEEQLPPPPNNQNNNNNQNPGGNSASGGEGDI